MAGEMASEKNAGRAGANPLYWDVVEAAIGKCSHFRYIPL